MKSNNKHNTQSLTLSPDNSSLSSVLSPQHSHKPTCWLVTGGCGFIGTNLIARLLKNDPGTNIRVLDNLSVGTREDLATVCGFTESDISSLSPESSVHSPQSLVLSTSEDASSVQLFVGDIRDKETCLKCCKNTDVVVHLAASTGVPASIENPEYDMTANVIGTFNMLDAARRHRVKRFIFASSGAPIGECDPPIHEEIAPHPVSPYGASKLAGEAYCSAFFLTFGLETIALRFSNVYGPGSGRKNSVVARFIRRAMVSEKLEIYGDGKQTRDFIFIDDLIHAICLAATVGGIGGQIFQIATNTETTVRGLVDKLLPILADSCYEGIEVLHKNPRRGDVFRNFSDISKAREVRGWKPECRLEDGLNSTVRWFITHSKGKSA